MIVLGVVAAAYFIACIDSHEDLEFVLGFGLPTRSNNESCLEWASKSEKNMNKFIAYGCSNISFYNQVSLRTWCAIAVILYTLELLLLLPFMIKCVGHENNDLFGEQPSLQHLFLLLESLETLELVEVYSTLFLEQFGYLQECLNVLDAALLVLLK
jgi:hypothetical protein